MPVISALPAIEVVGALAGPCVLDANHGYNIGARGVNDRWPIFPLRTMGLLVVDATRTAARTSGECWSVMAAGAM